MNPRPFLVRIPGYRDRGPELIQTAGIFVGFRQKMKTKRVVAGLFREVEHDGYDRSALNIGPRTPDDGLKPLAPQGWTRSGQVRTTIDRNSRELRKVLRRITPEAEAELAVADDRIAELEHLLTCARGDRAEIIGRAWKTGASVNLWDVEPEQGENLRRIP